MKAILTGSLVAGFALTAIVRDEEAEDIVVKTLANGTLCEAVDIQDPLSEIKDGCYEPVPDGRVIVVFNPGLGNGVSAFGPFDDVEIGNKFGEDIRSDFDDWEIFVLSN